MKRPTTHRVRADAREQHLALLTLLAACSAPAPAAPVDATLDATLTPDAVVVDTGSSFPDRDGARLTRANLAPVTAFLGEERCLRVVHDGPESTRARWIVEPDTTPFDGADTRCVTFTRVGTFRAFVTLTDGPRVVETNAVVTVVRRPTTVAPTASSTVLHIPSRRELWAVNPDSDTVAVVRTDTQTLVAEVEVCDRPRTLALRGDTLAVACQNDGHVDLLDVTTRTRTQRVALGAGSRPFGVAADPRGDRFVITLQDAGSLVVIDRQGARVGELTLGPDLRHVAINAEGTALIPAWRGAEQGATVYRVDLSNPAMPRRVEAVNLPRQEGIDSDTDNSGVPGFLGALAFAPHGRQAIVPALKANIVTGRARTRTDLTSQTTARAIFSEVDLDGPEGRAQESWRNVFDDLDLASAVTYTPLGERVYVAIEGAEVVLALDTAGFNVAGSIREVGGAPQGLAYDADRQQLWVHGFTSRTLRVFDVRNLSVAPTRLAQVITTTRDPLTQQQRLGLRMFYASRDPRMSRTSYLSCASCHHDGEGDNLTWDFTQRGEGLRNTIPLDGRGGDAHGPIHWSANFDELQDFEHDIRNGQGGTGFIADMAFHTGTRDTPLGESKAGLSEDLDAMAAWVATLTRAGVSPHRRDGDGAWETSFTRGRQVFVDAGCNTCHSGARFTDSAFVTGRTPLLHDVGTLRATSGQRLGATLTGLDTPTLRGLWRTAPYLHDGSAATLRDVLTTRNPMDQHGRTRALTPTQLDDLLVYLQALDDRVASAP